VVLAGVVGGATAALPKTLGFIVLESPAHSFVHEKQPISVEVSPVPFGNGSVLRLLPSMALPDYFFKWINPSHWVRNKMRNNHVRLSYGWASVALRSAS